MARKYTKRQWVSTQEAADHLKIHPETLRQLVRKKLLKPGIHYRNRSQGDRPTYQFDLDAINKFYG